ncbi:MAG: N-acetylneuraminate synthase family protein [Bacteroidota bacterium]
MNKITLGKRVITPDSMPYVIAEIGVNHEESMAKAKELIEQAKEGGADAAKFQSYKAETLASKHSPAYWDTTKEPTTSQYQLFKKHDSFGAREFVELAGHCKKVGIDFISTPFDDDAIEFLYPLLPFYKIASADITNFPFIRKIAKKGKPILLSTGSSTLGEIETAVHELRSHGCKELALLQCVLNYPTADENANLRMIHGLHQAFPDLIIGYSDHTLPDPTMLTLTAAFLMGAVIIEKHFTYDKSLPGNDHYHAMDVRDLKVFVKNLAKLDRLNGSLSKYPLPTEMISRKNARRSIVLKKNVPKGTILTEDMITYKRPGIGISPQFWDEVIGMRVIADLKEDDLLHWRDLE